MKSILAFLLLATVQRAATFNSDGTLANITTLLAGASANDTITVPAGTFTWGTSGAFVDINKAITLTGAGTGATIINIPGDAGSFTAATIRITAAATVKSMTVNQSSGAPVTFISASNTNGWRVTDIAYNGGTAGGYMMYIDNAYGCVDSNTITGGSGTAELFFIRGPTDSWQTASTMGTANNVYIESNTFAGDGYVCDANSDSRVVVRYNTISTQLKVDGHGLATNSPPRSVRHMEVYRNAWNQGGATFYTAIEIRGGTGIVFDNTAPDGAASHWFFLTDYGYLGQYPNFGNVYQTPVNYPINDQIGVGQDPKSAASAPYYVVGNRRAGVIWPRTYKDPVSGAIDLYRIQTSNPSAVFYESTLIQDNRDDFWEVSGYDGTSGCGRGTTAQMNAITPTLNKSGFWVTDQGTWNQSGSGEQGLLYVWNGSSWVLNYTPYTYPNPLRGSAVDAPSFSPVAGTYLSAQSVTISSVTPGATIRYTTNGVTPTNSVGTIYSTPVSIPTTTTLKAIAYNGVLTDSAVTSGTYTISAGGGGDATVIGTTTVTVELTVP